MTELLPVCLAISIFLLTYLLHSTVVIMATMAVAGRFKPQMPPDVRVLVWKLALLLPIVSSFAVSAVDVPSWSVFRFSLFTADTTGDGSPKNAFGMAHEKISAELLEAGAPIVSGVQPEESTRQQQPALHQSAAAYPIDRESTGSGLKSASWVSSMDRRLLCLLAVGVWTGLVIAGFVRLGIQLRQLKQLRRNAERITCPEMCQALDRLRGRFRMRTHVELLQSRNIAGPLTAGVFRPFILLPVETSWDNPYRRDAVLSHELVHIARCDAYWNLVIQIVKRAFPFQPLNWYIGRQLRREMDFVADAFGAQTSAERIGLAAYLFQFGDQLTPQGSSKRTSELAACMSSFRSMLGRRIDALLDENNALRKSGVAARLAVIAVMLAGIITTTYVVPRAVAHDSNDRTKPDLLHNTRNSEMNRPFTTLAILAGLTIPSPADESAKKDPPADSTRVPAELKTTPDPLPDGILRFNGMLVGRLAAKDVEKGTFLLQIDAVPRVWRNSRAEDPKSIVGRAVEISGVFGRFLDVLVVTRIGETIECECRHDGDRLVFPGELLRKVAAYDPSDYPELPESFRGFQGAIAGTVVKKDPETFELIFQVDRVTDTWKDNSAKQPKSIEGKPLMLAGFWNRKEQYHNLKVGSTIEVGAKHIGLRSDHLTVAEYVRTSEKRADREMKKSADGEESRDSMTKQQRGFRGMMVGRLVEKDIERGTFTVIVDAVPRVWKNNKSSSPKSFLGTRVAAEGVTGKMLDALVVTKPGDTIEFGALHDGVGRMRVGEVLRKVAPVKPGDYPVLPDEFRGFKGMVTAKVMRKDDHLMDLVVEIRKIGTTFPDSRARRADSIVGKNAIVAGFWQRKEAFHDINVGDTIECGLEHSQQLSDHLSVIESVRKVQE